VATAVSIYYYLAVVRSLYMRAATGGAGLAVAGGSPARDVPLQLGIGAAVVVAVGSFFVVQPLIDVVTKAAFSLPWV
jgi:NADH:ubiquinone oxidoreductase subunit 2 (subunit N)